MKQPTKFVLYAVVDAATEGVLAVALSRQEAKHELNLLRDTGAYADNHPFKVRRAKGVLFDT